MAKKAITKVIDGVVHSVHSTKATKTLKPLDDVLCPIHNTFESYIGFKGFKADELLSMLRSAIVIRLQAQSRSLASGGKMPDAYRYAKIAELMQEDAERYTLEVDGVQTLDAKLMQADVEACWENESKDSSTEDE